MAWVVRLSLRPNDKRLQLYREGKMPEPPTEEVWLVEPNPKAGEPIAYAPGQREPAVVGLKLEELGVGGVLTYLQRGNTWSGRGEFASLEEQAQKAMDHNAAEREKFRRHHKEESRHEQRDRRRWRFKIPFVRVLTDLKRSK